MNIFFDTGAFYALADKKDKYHQSATNYYNENKSGVYLSTNIIKFLRIQYRTHFHRTSYRTNATKPATKNIATNKNKSNKSNIAACKPLPMGILVSSNLGI